jgi:hypothetical protein
MSRELIKNKSAQLGIDIVQFVEAMDKTGDIFKYKDEWPPEFQWKYTDLLEKRALLRLHLSFYDNHQRRRR